ncbi:MAG: hypothetical protein JO194_02430 [Candidatus Eremiobacteraeota bacterium]|nr:hypothetical protein [Candidatus Eremiobacteraeota bacterium]
MARQCCETQSRIAPRRRLTTPTTTSTFFALDRILSATSTRSGYTTESVSWTYDDATSGHFGIGRLASMSDPTGSTSYSYERRGLLETEARTILGTLYNLAYGYDYNGNRNSLTYPDSSVVSYGFDWADRPISAAGGSNTYVSSASYEPFGPIQQLVFGNGSTQTFSYDQRYRPSEDKLVHGATTIADYLYQEDAVGNITQINDNTNSGYNRTFGYDDLNRLTTANSGASLWGTATGNGYTYDLMGNMKTLQLGPGRTASFAYSGTLPKLTSVAENGTPRSVSYDAAGNEITVGSASYAYTPRNLLSSGDSLSYVYDGWGRRAVSTASTGSRYSFYGPDMTLLAETNVTTGTPTVAYKYIYFGGRPLAQSDSSGVHYSVADHLGTPLLQTDSSNNVYWRAEEEPYGKVWALRAGDVHQPLRLPGQVAEQFDTGANGATERSYNDSRWYRPTWARFTQSDPIGLNGGWNLYDYVNDKPTSDTDPEGLRVRFGARPVSGFPEPFDHGFLLIEPDNPADFGGVTFFTLELKTAQCGNVTYLNRGMNYSLSKGYSAKDLEARSIDVFRPEGFKTDTDFIRSLLAHFDALPSYWVPYHYVFLGSGQWNNFEMPGTLNSNGLVPGLLNLYRFRDAQGLDWRYSDFALKLYLNRNSVLLGDDNPIPSRLFDSRVTSRLAGECECL